MAQELEIEFRNLITKEEYQTLTKAFKVKETDFFEQTNYYLDTDTFALKEKQSALRIRKKKDYYELTLKTPANKGLLETTQILGADQADSILKGSYIPVGQVRDELLKHGVRHEELVVFGSLRTIRAEKAYKKGLLVFDQNFYGDIVDYDLEYEVTDDVRGQKIFSELLADYAIVESPAPNKIERFYNKIYKSQH
ncbi:CYTH domain-containing protein [Listeria costaricensis]|uniref:CYTH domain-containing protein n=1 Tax=Listeria costaricensis TaxID=2026604 RepID=UPI000C089047|nr:CYTH domain-containing protein [Listeria costaricensis]